MLICNLEVRVVKKVLLINNQNRPETESVAQEMAGKLAKYNLEVIRRHAFSPPVQMEDADLAIVLGGDGTILRTARYYAVMGIPLLGINMGRIGFLSKLELSEVDEYLEPLIKGQYSFSERLMLDCQVLKHGEVVFQSYCLNEVAFRSTSPLMVGFDLEIDGQLTANYRGDGMIVSTPTGSTGYSLSCGGPITDPDIEVLLITPIAPHASYKRPMVLDASKRVAIKYLSGVDAAVCVDGQVQTALEIDQVIKVSPAPFKLKMIKLKPSLFFYQIEARIRRSED